MMLFDFLPILIISIVAALLLFLVMRSKSGHMKYLYAKRVYWLLGSYLIILLIATGVYLFIPKQDYAYSEKTSQTNIPNLADLVYEGKSLDNVQMYIKNQWELPYEQNQLQIVGEYEKYPDFDVLVSVERKLEDDGIIEVTHYQTPIIVNDLVDITEYMDPIEVELSSTTLKIAGAEYVDEELSIYKNDFPARQFTGESGLKDWGYIFARQVLLLRIPKDLQIIDANEHFDIHYAQE